MAVRYKKERRGIFARRAFFFRDFSPDALFYIGISFLDREFI